MMVMKDFDTFQALGKAQAELVHVNKYATIWSWRMM